MSIVFYLLEASIGLPVLRGVFNPIWFTGPTAGYLFAFPFAGFLIARFRDVYQSIFWKVVLLFLAQAFIFFLGFCWLSQFVGFSKAFKLGVLVFIPFGVLKVILTIALYRLISWRKECQ